MKDNAETIIKTAAEYYGVSEEKILMPDKVKGSRKKETVKARHVVIAAIKEFTDLSLTSIGELVGNRDHSSVIHALEAVQDSEDTNMNYKREFRKFKNLIAEKLDMPDLIDEEFKHLI